MTMNSSIHNNNPFAAKVVKSETFPRDMLIIVKDDAQNANG